MSEISAEPAPRQQWIVRAAGALLILGAALLLFARAMDRDLNHDEHQFLAPAALLSREGLHPYRDYPLFHLPNLVFAYAAADRLTGGQLILGAKLISVAASVAVVVMLVLMALQRRTFGAWWGGMLLAVCVVTLLLFDPLFSYTAGKTWNHEVPAAFAAGALLCLLRAASKDSLRAVAGAGLCMGMAVGCRLTFAPGLLVAGFCVFLFALPLRRRIQHALAFGAAALLSLAPSLFYLATVPEAFIFGNLEFPRLALMDPENTRIHKTGVWWRKLRYFFKEIVFIDRRAGVWSGSLPLFFAMFTFVTSALLRRTGTREGSLLPVQIAALLLIGLLAGCFAPSRYQYQHFFALLPVAAMAIVLGAQHGAFGRSRRGGPIILSALAAGALLMGGGAYGGLSLQPEKWFHKKVEQDAAQLQAHLPLGVHVLTLAPTWPLAGGFKIYPEFATAPFGWRNGRFVEPPRRRSFHVVAPADLEAVFGEAAPPAILTGVEKDKMEQPLVRFAMDHQYRRVKLERKRDLWILENPLQ